MPDWRFSFPCAMMVHMRSTKLVILFGSRARETAGANSDFDVAVTTSHTLSLEERSEFARKAATKLHTTEDHIDLVDLAVASPLLQQQVAASGKLIEGNAADFVRFRVLAWKRYLDTAKLRRARTQALSNHYGA